MNDSKMAVKNKVKNSVKLDSAYSNFSRFFNFRIITKVMSVLIVFASVSYMGLYGINQWSKIWPVKKVILKGDNFFLNQQDIVELVKQNSVNGMLTIDINYLQWLVKNNEWVNSVNVRKLWPDTLVFNIQEHQPVVRFNEFVLTQQGTRIELTDGLSEIKHLDKIELVGINQLTKGDDFLIWKEFELMKQEFNLIGLTLVQLNVDSIRSWSLLFKNKMQVIIGKKERRKKLKQLNDVYAFIENRHKIKKIDLRYHNGFSVEWIKNDKLQLKG